MFTAAAVRAVGCQNVAAADAEMAQVVMRPEFYDKTIEKMDLWVSVIGEAGGAFGLAPPGSCSRSLDWEEPGVSADERGSLKPAGPTGRSGASPGWRSSLGTDTDEVSEKLVRNGNAGSTGLSLQRLFEERGCKRRRGTGVRRAGGGRRRFQRPSRVPAAANLKPKDDQAARPAAVQLGRGFCLRLRLAAVHTARPGWFSLPGCGLPSQVTGLTRVMSTASWVGTIPEREAVAYDLDAPAVVDRHIEVHSRQSNVTTNAGSGFMADARDCLLDRNGSAGEDARRGTSVRRNIFHVQCGGFVKGRRAPGSAAELLRGRGQRCPHGGSNEGRQASHTTAGYSEDVPVSVLEQGALPAAIVARWPYNLLSGYSVLLFLQSLRVAEDGRKYSTEFVLKPAKYTAGYQSPYEKCSNRHVSGLAAMLAHRKLSLFEAPVFRRSSGGPSPACGCNRCSQTPPRAVLW
ncbi:hypothetical protein AK812_SmicGene21680 [Symbiodinium microadriaticum]|uniref:Uncharacterized protein n=1 Tax=Symbiodinium microadriaticum TaxID=2951 RepID=A0A1Q9DLT7_SYMMI|nr:hypothetical protein AK812_SmicGene21680 [Symbiodinium microadriaticum]